MAHWMEFMNNKDQIKVIWWSIFCNKRYFLFIENINQGYAVHYAFKNISKMSFKKVRENYKKLENDEIRASNNGSNV